MVPKLLVLAVEFHRAPLRFRHLTDRSQPLPDDFGNWLAESSAALSPTSIDATAAAMDLTPAALQESFLFFLRHALLLPSADHYRVLGLPRNCSADAIKHNYSLLVRLFHPDRTPTRDERRIALTARINAAYHSLRDPKAKAQYDQRLLPLPAYRDGGAQGRDFFQPNDPIYTGARALDHANRKAFRVRPLLLGVLGCVVVGALAMLLLRGSDDPAFRMDPERVVTAAPSPAYLRRADEATPLGGFEPTAPLRLKEHSAASAESRTPLPSVVDTVSAPAGARTTLPQRDAADSTPVPGLHAGDDADRASALAGPGRLLPNPPTAQALPTPKPGPEPTRAAGELHAAVRPLERWPSSLTDHAARSGPEPEASAPIIPGADSVREPRSASAPSRKSAATSRHTPPDPPAQDDHPGLAEATALISRLKRFYVNGDLHRLTGLFRADAVVNEGSGVASIRRQFAAAFERDSHRRISIFDLSWSQGPDQRLSGEGRIRVLGRESVTSEWHLESGTIEFELVPWRGDYRIAKMIHHLSRN